jgi:signal transduction histidine kinase
MARLSPAGAAKITMTSTGEARLIKRPVSEEIAPIVGEAVQNAVSHASANHIEIEIRYGDDELFVRIRDDGRGFDTSQFAQGAPSRHFGLLGMSERAQRVGGQLEILSRESHGTQVILRIPHERAYASHKTQGFLKRILHRFTYE